MGFYEVFVGREYEVGGGRWGNPAGKARWRCTSPPGDQMRGTGVNREHLRLQHQRVYYDVLYTFINKLADAGTKGHSNKGKKMNDEAILGVMWCGVTYVL